MSEEPLIARIAAASTAFHAGWLELLREQPGNPSGVDIVRLAEGRIVATVATEMPEVEWLQHVCGLRAGDDEEIFELATWYAELDAWPRYEVPVDAEDDLLHTLLAVEAKPTGALAVLAGDLADLMASPLRGHVRVSEVFAGSPAVEQFARAHLAGHEVPGGGAPEHVAAVAGWVAQPDWRCFLAELEGEIVGAAALVVLDDVGYLANASTLPLARSRGVQSALIAARIDAARALRCDLVCSLAEPDGSSARNLVRAGLGVVGARTYWSSTA
ncbi:MAG: GNAT family N-acetyltransferase [Acidimicrobiales bacterium]